MRAQSAERRAQSAECRVFVSLPSTHRSLSPHLCALRSALCAPRRGYTLIEVLIVLGLLVVLLGAIWGIVEMFSQSFVRGETRAERSQLVRSLSMLVTDDLACAIQDPLHPARELNTNAVRRFGLSGTNTSMRIDVLQINPFRPGSTTAQYGVQAPELKTVYYDFTLLSPLSPEGGGLTRRELDFETPTGMPSFGGLQNGLQTSDGLRASGFGLQGEALNTNPEAGSLMPEAGSLMPEARAEARSLTDYGGSASLTDRVATTNTARSQQPQMTMMTPEMQAANAAARNAANEKLQLEMSAPEVVGCRFRYYDGGQWRDSWNSLNQRGLPVAIEITLKMMPLADARMLRDGLQTSGFRLQGEASNTNPEARSLTSEVRPEVRPEAGSLKPEASSLTDFGAAPSLTDRVMQQNRMRNQPTVPNVEQIAEQLDLLPPTEQRIVIRVPTTPLTSQQELLREQPTAASNPATAPPRQQAQRQQAQRSVGQRGAASPARQPRQPAAGQTNSPDWIRQ